MRKCNGSAVACDLCGLAVAKTYHRIYFHYWHNHAGTFGKLLGDVKPTPGKRRTRRTLTPDQLISINILVPLRGDKLKCYYTKTAEDWQRLARQGPVWNTKNEDQLALACAIETYKLEYLQ